MIVDAGRVRRWAASLARRLVSVLALLASAGPAAAAPDGSVVLPAPAGEFRIDPATLAVWFRPAGGDEAALAVPAMDPGQVTDGTGHGWRLAAGSDAFTIEAAVEGEALRLSIRSDRPATLAWPQTADPAAITAYAMPFGEGSYIPADDPAWLGWLTRRYEPAGLAEQLSMPFWTELRAGRSITWLVETPFNTWFAVVEESGRPRPVLAHDFTRLAPGAPYVVRIVPGPPDPLAGARTYRTWLQAGGGFVPLTEKIAALPDIARLGGAPHIYLGGKGPLKPEDVLQWRAFVRLVQQKRDDPGHLAGRLWQAFGAEARAEFERAFKDAAGAGGFVSVYSRAALTRAVNEALRRAVPMAPVDPLPGGHDPAAEAAWATGPLRAALAETFGPLLAPPERWGGGLSLDTVAALRTAGLTRAWLGVEDWRDALWHPEAVAAAKAAGYLVGAYDSYGSAHPPDLPETWPTAQMGADLAAAGYVDSNGRTITGFAGRGVYASAVAAEPYARRRIAAAAKAAGLDSLFLDVDATGLVFDDYAPGRETGEAQDADARRRRLAFAASLGLVVGSEGGSALFAPQIAFAHGMTTQPFAWMVPEMKDKASPYYRGNYWPPETPSLYFNPVRLKPEVARFVADPRFRLPLYEIALHDSVVTTHHWEYGSLKFSDQREATALLQLLYAVPPLYHLNAAVLDRDLPIIAAYDRVFRPLHERVFARPMMDFAVLSPDRLLQRSSFGDGTTVTVNFDAKPRALPGGATLPAQSARIEAPDQPSRTVEIGKVVK
ncbi:glycoside hydrolase [Inquilinus sp. Marseille-Q2685]|uniref:glycoside hydrolase n=1 Tax=Inquilinus sp. Marseille-Q2685 TaxID=2866581 RepID=UPI001CE4022F|nr:glycoside hydrolase [Inquilinus sp. Marseille-Q2685]